MDKNRLINTFLKIVQIDSPTGYEKEMVAWVCAKLSNLGIDYKIDDFGNIIARVGSGDRSHLLTAHLDTVEPGRGIKPVILDGLIKSSGDTILGADNKIAVAVILEVLENIKEQKLDVPLEIVFTLSEEVGNLGAVNLDYSLLKAVDGFSFDSEGEIGKVIVGSPFYSRFDIEIIGESAHASKPENAVNALLVINNALNKIKIGRVDDDTICNIGIIEGGSVRNTIPGKIILKGEVRSFVEGKLEEAVDNIKNSLFDSANIFGAQIKINVVRENSGYRLNKTDRDLEFVAKTFESLKIKPKFVKSYGCSDANIFLEHGIKIINLADGSRFPHTNNEYISIKSLFLLSKLISHLVMVE